jgi:hypothetical protein
VALLKNTFVVRLLVNLLAASEAEVGCSSMLIPTLQEDQVRLKYEFGGKSCGCLQLIPNIRACGSTF